MYTGNHKELFSTKNYEFLHQEQDLGDQLLYLVLNGSKGYGTSLGHSDTDIRGVAIERKEVLLGLETFEQYEELETDTVVYGLKKYVQLLMRNNPSALEFLGAAEENILYLSPVGKALRQSKELFLSKQVGHTFGQYATAQLRRLQNALARDQYPQAEKEKHLYNVLKNQIAHFNRQYTSFDEHGIRLNLEQSEMRKEISQITMDINLKDYPLRDFVNIYGEMSNVVKDYTKLNKRNRKKTDDKLFKHAMHLIRILKMGIEILEEGQINTFREKDRDELISIRKGNYTFDEIFSMINYYEEEHQRALAKTTLPEYPDKTRINKALMSWYEEFYKY